MFDFDKAGLLLIDLQEEGRAGGKWPVKGFDGVVNNASKLLSLFRETGKPVFHVRTIRLKDGSDSPPLAPRYEDGRPVYGADEGPGAKFAQELSPKPAEQIITKQYSSAFKKTELDEKIRRSGITGLVVVGVWTEECVFLTVKDAVDNGFPVWLVEDACGSGEEDIHEAAIKILKKRLYGGGISLTEPLLNRLSNRLVP